MGTRKSFSGQFIYPVAIMTIMSVIPFLAEAQSLSFGPKVGVSVTSFAGNDVPDEANAVANFAGGAFFKFQPGDIVAVQPEVLYHRKGGTTRDSEGDDGLDLSVDYLEIPVLIKFQIPLGGTVYPFLYAGPYGAFELGNTFSGSYGPIEIITENELDINDFDAGALVGGGLDFQVGPVYLGFDARYGIGMTEILVIDGEQQDYKNRNASLFVSLGVNL